MNNFTKFQNDLQENFFKRLEKKTGWGKEEVKKEYIEAKSEVTMKTLDDNMTFGTVK